MCVGAARRRHRNFLEAQHKNLIAHQLFNYRMANEHKLQVLYDRTALRVLEKLSIVNSS